MTTRHCKAGAPGFPSFTFCTEEELLLCCSRLHLEPDTRHLLQELLAGPLDWPYILQLAREHSPE
jgi:hypothetical protein